MDTVLVSEGMPADAGLGLASLLCARLCHDLAGPLGAVASGAELLAEAPDPETARLVAASAEGAAARLRFLRLALGPDGAPQTVGDLRRLAEGWMRAAGSTGGRAVRLDWPEAAADRLSGARARLVLLLILVGHESLPLGGTLRLTAAGAPVGAVAGLRIEGEGPQATLPAEAESALVAGLPPAGPRAAPAWVLRLLAAAEGRVPRLRVAPGRVTIDL